MFLTVFGEICGEFGKEVIFNTGAGAVDREIEQYYEDMVKSH